MATFRYRNTFIDGETEVEAFTGRHRSKSWPQRCQSSGEDVFHVFLREVTQIDVLFWEVNVALCVCVCLCVESLVLLAGNVR